LRPPSGRDEQVGEGEEGSSAAETEARRRTKGCLPSQCGPSAEEGAAPPGPGEVSGGGGGLDHERDMGRRGGKIKMVGPTFGGGMEGLQEWRVGGGI
jgi:hypothetical protein